ncbi:HD domain-containing protein [Candidatus Bipolaricaulota bacterium]|nr:HD domain-containing protein [Candidatus Bipolaricaulota bacterium]
MNDEDLANIARFIFELGQLKRTPRSGWLKLGVDNPESVAEHSFRTAAIGFLLGKLEGENSYEVAGYCLFHDMAETRTLDLDWLAQDYLKKRDYISSDVVNDQLSGLPKGLKGSLKELLDGSTKSEGVKQVARDADLLELIFQAFEIAHQGNPLAEKWATNTLPSLKTDSGRQIGEFLKEKQREGRLNHLVTWWEEAGPNQGQDNQSGSR